MPRAPATADVFNAIAEPRRRRIVDALSRPPRPCSVSRLVELLDLPQPTVSKHLAVLRSVGVVSVQRRGRQRLYRLEADRLKAVHDWVSAFEHFWSHQLGRIKDRAERASGTAGDEPDHSPERTGA